MKSKKRILIFNPYYSESKRTAANTCFEKLFENVHLFTDDCTLIASCSRVPEWLRVDSVNLISVKFTGSISERLWSFITTSFYLMVNRFDIVFSEFNPLPLTAFLSKKVWLRIHHIERDIVSRRGRFRESFLRLYLKLCSQVSFFLNNYRIVTVSKKTKDDISDLGILSANKIDVVYNGVDSGKLSKYVNTSKQMRLYKYDLIYVGNFSIRKNVQLIPQALSSIPHPLRILMVGRDLGTREKVQEICSKLCNHHQFTFLENLSEEQVLSAYSESAVFISSSLCEGFGMPVVEATCLGVPVICTDLEVFREVAPHASFFPKNSLSGLSDAISNTIEKYKFIKDSSLEKSKTSLEYYSWPLHTKAFLSSMFSDNYDTSSKTNI